MCQINTDPMMFQTATLDVNVPPDIGLRNMVLAKNSVFIRISNYYGQIQTQGQKLSGKHAPHV